MVLFVLHVSCSLRSQPPTSLSLFLLWPPGLCPSRPMVSESINSSLFHQLAEQLQQQNLEQFQKQLLEHQHLEHQQHQQHQQKVPHPDKHTHKRQKKIFTSSGTQTLPLVSLTHPDASSRPANFAKRVVTERVEISCLKSIQPHFSYSCPSNDPIVTGVLLIVFSLWAWRGRIPSLDQRTQSQQPRAAASHSILSQRANWMNPLTTNNRYGWPLPNIKDHTSYSKVLLIDWPSYWRWFDTLLCRLMMSGSGTVTSQSCIGYCMISV